MGERTWVGATGQGIRERGKGATATREEGRGWEGTPPLLNLDPRPPTSCKYTYPRAGPMDRWPLSARQGSPSSSGDGACRTAAGTRQSGRSNGSLLANTDGCALVLKIAVPSCGGFPTHTYIYSPPSPSPRRLAPRTSAALPGVALVLPMARAWCCPTCWEVPSLQPAGQQHQNPGVAPRIEVRVG